MSILIIVGLTYLAIGTLLIGLLIWHQRACLHWKWYGVFIIFYSILCYPVLLNDIFKKPDVLDISHLDLEDPDFNELDFF